MSQCVTTSELERFHAGELPADEQARIASHLARCAACASAGEALRRSHDARGAPVRNPFDETTPMSRASVRPPADRTADVVDVHARGGKGAAPDFAIEGYRFVGEIHRGGQGVVYLAMQEATRRQVAIKVLREGPLADAQELSRFRREVRILAQLNHPHIVTIHDSGAAAGHSYYVMDYIEGEPLDEFVYGRIARGVVPGSGSGPAWTTRDTLALFAQLCEALSAAHERGIIHRDLKPGNIRVDCSGAAHILDFGVAKVSSFHTGEHPSIRTITGQFVGSLPWASPEQAEGAAGRVDATTDVYSLGVILYQLLTGRFPYPVVGSMREVLDHILRTEPARPSTIRRDIEPEVETIVLKCLSKARERRYPSAAALASDVRRFLSGEPIEAKRDSRWYVLRKRLPRYKLAAAVAGAVLIAAAGLLAVSHQRGQLAAQRQRERESVIEQCRDAVLLVDGERLEALLERAAGLGADEATLAPLRGWADLIFVDLAAARRRVERALQLTPNNAEARYLSAALAANDGEWVRAANDFALAQKNSRGTPLEIGLQAVVKVTLRQYDSALADVDELVRRQNAAASALWARGFCRWAQLMRDPPLELTARRSLAQAALDDINAAAHIYPRVAFLFDTRADLTFRFAEIARVLGDETLRQACLRTHERDIERLRELGAGPTAAVYLGTRSLMEGDLDQARDYAAAALEGLAAQTHRASINREDTHNAAVHLALCVAIARGEEATVAMQIGPTLIHGFLEGLRGDRAVAGDESGATPHSSSADGRLGEWLGAVARGDGVAAERIGREFSVPVLQRFGPSWGTALKRVMEFGDDGTGIRRAAGAEVALLSRAALAQAMLAPDRATRLAGLQKVLQLGHPDAAWLLVHTLIQRARRDSTFLAAPLTRPGSAGGIPK